MVENFEQLKKQLSELATVLNEFKSEAVQLRLLELVFEMGSESDESDDRVQSKPRSRVHKPKATRKMKDLPVGGPKKTRGGSGSGAVATVGQLVTGDFFRKPRTINDIIEHCKHNMARTFKPNEFSGKLGRLVREGELSRKKNADNQYEYTAK